MTPLSPRPAGRSPQIFPSKPDRVLIRDADAVVAGTRLLGGSLLTKSVNQSQALRRPGDCARLLAGGLLTKSMSQSQATRLRLDDCARLLAGCLSTESVAAHVARLQAGRHQNAPARLQACHPSSLQARLQSGLQALSPVRPSGRTTQVLPPLLSSSTSTPSPQRRRRPCPPGVGRWDLSESVGCAFE